MRIIVAALSLILICACLAQAESSLSWDICLTGGVHAGETKYNLEFLVDPGRVNGASELIFPVDVAVVGVEVSGAVVTGGLAKVTYGVRFNTSATDPSGPFTDRDWYIYMGQIEQDFSYTESDVEVSMMNLEAEVTALLATSPQMDLSLVAGVGYQDIGQEAVSLDGTQVVTTDSGTFIYTLLYQGKALTYDISYLRPHVGFMPRLYFGPNTVIELKAAAGPVKVSDTDNHILRNFESKSSGWGWGAQGRFEFQYRMNSDDDVRAPFVRVFGEFFKMGANLEETRVWYGDDPATDDFNDTGTTLTDIQHEVRSTQYELGIQLGLHLF